MLPLFIHCCGKVHLFFDLPCLSFCYDTKDYFANFIDFKTDSHYGDFFVIESGFYKFVFPFAPTSYYNFFIVVPYIGYYSSFDNYKITFLFFERNSLGNLSLLEKSVISVNDLKDKYDFIVKTYNEVFLQPFISYFSNNFSNKSFKFSFSHLFDVWTFVDKNFLNFNDFIQYFNNDFFPKFDSSNLDVLNFFIEFFNYKFRTVGDVPFSVFSRFSNGFYLNHFARDSSTNLYFNKGCCSDAVI